MSSRLRRSKSAASYTTRSVQTDENVRSSPGVVRDHAYVAANTAFEKARDSRENQRNRRDFGQSDLRPQILREKRSVRFTGPNAVSELNRPITRRQAKTWVEVNSESKVSSNKNRDRGLSLRGSPGNLTALPSIQSTSIPTSSYRKLKKAKSMFNPRRERPEYFLHASPRTPFSHSPKGKVTIHTGLSPGRPLPTADELLSKLPNPYQRTFDQEAAIRMARDEYLRQLDTQKVRELTGSIDEISSGPAQKSFPRTVRSSSINSFGPAVGSETPIKPLKKTNFSLKARTGSWNLKDKIKRVFHRNVESSIPAQQIDAQRAHYHDFSLSDFEKQCTDPDIPIPDQALMSRVSSRASSIAHSPTALGSRPRVPSGESVESTKSDAPRSRVTSWTNSTITTNMTSQKLQANERKRLSIIQENGGPHQPSTSTSTSYGSARFGYAAFRKPLQVGQSASPLDGQRMFSALQKRIDEKKSVQIGGTFEEEEKDGEASASEQGPPYVPKKKRCASRESQKTARTTIRLVDDGSNENKRELKVVRGSRSFNLEYAASASTDDVFKPLRLPSNESKNSRTPSSSRMSFQQIADENENPLKFEKRPLRESKSAFFPPQSDYVPEKTSPFRRAMRASAGGKRPLLRQGDRGRNCLGDIASSQDSLDSGSVYSRDTSGITPSNEKANFRRAPRSNSALGQATIIDTKPIVEQYAAILNKNRPIIREPSSQGSSGDWKGWLASQVAELEKLNQGKMTIRDPSSCRTRPTKHHRECAQINDDGGGGIKESALQPITNKRRTSINRPRASQSPSSQQNEMRPLRYPLYPSDEPSSTTSMAVAVANASKSITVRENATARQVSNENMKHTAGWKSKDQRRLSARASEPTLKMKSTDRRGTGPTDERSIPSLSQKNSGDDRLGAKLTSSSNRSSPERTARLRRMKSNVLVGFKDDPRTVDTLRWAQNQQENHTINSISPLSRLKDSPLAAVVSSVDTLPDENNRGSSRMVELFLSRRRGSGGAGSAAHAFI